MTPSIRLIYWLALASLGIGAIGAQYGMAGLMWLAIVLVSVFGAGCAAVDQRTEERRAPR